MKMRLLWSFILLFVMSGMIARADNALSGKVVVVGKIVNSEGKGLPYATLAVKDTPWGTSADENGFFNLKIKPGQYQFVFSYTGYKEQSQSFDLFHVRKLNLGKIILKSQDKLINEVVVGGNRGVTRTDESDYVARLPLKNIENPQVYVTVNSQLLDHQMNTELGSALKNIPGSGVPVKFNQNRIAFFSRGFLTQPRIRNGLVSFIQTTIDPVNLERIEVIKGPSATLFGSSVVSYGGLLNRVTKKPMDKRTGEIAWTSGSWDLNRVTLDVNSPLNADHSLLFRLNGVVHKENSFQDAGFSNSFAFDPSFSYRISDKVKLFADVEYGQNKGTSPIRFNPFTKVSGTYHVEDMGIAYDRSFASNEVAYNSQAFNIFLRMNADLGKHWTSQTAVSRASSGFDGYTSQLNGKSDSTLQPQVTTGDYDYYSTDIQQNFVHQFKIGSTSHKLLLGVDYYHYKDSRDIAKVKTAVVNFKEASTDFYDTYNVSYIDSAARSASRQIQYRKRSTYSAYFSDVAQLTRQFSVMLGLRLDHYRDGGTHKLTTGKTTGAYNQTVLSPKVGLVYQLLHDHLSLFGNYLNGFSNQSGTDKDGNSFKPENAVQYEGGLKADLIDHRLSGSISYYHILVNDVLRDDPDDADYSIQDGKQRSSGIDMDLSIVPVDGLNILLGYALNKSEYLKADDTVDGLRPASAGPENTFNWWGEYTFPKGSLAGLEIGYGGNYGSSSYQTNTQSTKVIIPSYLTMDLKLGWTYRNISVGVKVDNLTNKKYWSYRLAPQNPRRFSANLSLKF